MSKSVFLLLVIGAITRYVNLWVLDIKGDGYLVCSMIKVCLQKFTFYVDRFHSFLVPGPMNSFCLICFSPIRYLKYFLDENEYEYK
jgi:hypothetical protein